MSTLPKKPRRPTGITVFAILYGIGLAASILMIFFFSAIPFLTEVSFILPSSMVAIIFGIVAAINGLMLYALLSAKSWGRTVIRILAIVGIILDILHLNVIGLIINIIILWYMSQPHVKEYFNVES